MKMQHPNGCVHEVREDLVDKFLSAGWVIKAAQIVPPISPAEPKKRKPRNKKQ